MGMREAFECLKGRWVSVINALQSFTIFYPSFRSTSTADVPSREFGDFCNGKPELPFLLKFTIQEGDRQMSRQPSFFFIQVQSRSGGS